MSTARRIDWWMSTIYTRPYYRQNKWSSNHNHLPHKTRQLGNRTWKICSDRILQWSPPPVGSPSTSGRDMTGRNMTHKLIDFYTHQYHHQSVMGVKLGLESTCTECVQHVYSESCVFLSTCLFIYPGILNLFFF
jgi:hypothetical protein